LLAGSNKDNFCYFKSKLIFSIFPVNSKLP
jgi:hypothetical protein